MRFGDSTFGKKTKKKPIHHLHTFKPKKKSSHPNVRRRKKKVQVPFCWLLSVCARQQRESPDPEPHPRPWRRRLTSELPLLVAAVTEGARARAREVKKREINMHKLKEPERGFNCVYRRVKLRLMEGGELAEKKRGEAELAESVVREIIQGHFQKMITVRYFATL